MSKLYVGNLPYRVSEQEIADAFGAYGTVTSVVIVTDRETQRSKGFGFVEMGSEDEADAAMNGMNGAAFGGRNLRVDKARPKADDGRGGDRRPPRRNTY